MCLCYLIEPSPIFHSSYKPAILIKELKIDFWCFSSTGFRGYFNEYVLRIYLQLASAINSAVVYRGKTWIEGNTNI